MNDDLLVEIMCASRDCWRQFAAKAIASRLQRELANCDEAFEDHAGPIEDCLLDTASAFRAVRASRGGRGDKREAAAEAGESLTRLMEQIVTVRREALAAVLSSEQ